MEIIRIIVGELQTNCFLLVCGKELAVIDPGGEADRILEAVKKTGADPKCIINTHYHFDHTLANQKLQTVLGIPAYIHENEKNYVGFEVGRWLKEDDEIKIGDCALKVVLTPGHTLGSICLFGPDFVFSGDTIFEVGIGRCDYPGGSIDQLKESLKKLDGLIKPGTCVYPGHGEIFDY